MQMKAFADKFAETLAASLPSLSLHHADVPLGLLGANDKLALAHQRAVRTAMKRDQDDLRSSVDKPSNLNDLESITAALENLQVSESVATCITVALPACMQGPKHVAELIIAEERKQERILHEEQNMLSHFGSTNFSKHSSTGRTPRNQMCLWTPIFLILLSTEEVAAERQCLLIIFLCHCAELSSADKAWC